MGRRPARLKTAALVYRDVDEHRTRPHLLDHRRRHQLRRRRTGNQHRADHEIGIADQLFDRGDGRIRGLQLVAKLGLQFAQALDRTVNDRDVGAQADRHLRGVRAGHTATEDDDLRRRHAGHAAEQHAGATVRLLQRRRADLDRHPTGDFAHRRQQRQRTVGRGDGLVGDAGGLGFDQRDSLVFVRGQMQVGEEHLALLQHAALGGLRLLDLDDHLGAGKDVGGGGGDRGAGRLVGGVVKTDAQPCLGLDRHRVAGAHELTDAVRRQADAVLMNLDFLGNADTHRVVLRCTVKEATDGRSATA